MPIDLVFETHSTTLDNEVGRATGWLPGELSRRGVEEAVELGRRRAGELAAVFCSDLARAVQTAVVAFGGSDVPVLYDWRLRECDYGKWNGIPVADLHRTRRDHLDSPYPNGESWRQATARVGRFLCDLPLRWEGRRVLVIGHVATRWGLDRFLNSARLEDLADEDFAWREGWEYTVG